jgi:hypothetical protein
MNRKAELFPERYQSERFFTPRTLREWDNSITAPECGYRDATDYYDRGSALHVTCGNPRTHAHCRGAGRSTCSHLFTTEFGG